ncbi:MAG: hypothetical protein IT365_19915 [Candidatus Hydrogenedentes bacterium]|nr:hypothetical protein [Candidatus Hydrogenedentota bacterium]
MSIAHYVVLLGTLVFAGILICRALSSGSKSEDALADAEQRMRDAGHPVTLEELNAYYPEVQRDQNTALVYGQAATLLESADPGRERTNSLFERLKDAEATTPIAAELLREIESHLSACGGVLSALDQALALQESRYPVDLRRGFSSDLDYLAPLRSCWRLEALRGALALSRGQSSDFVQSQLSMLHIAGSLRNEPLILSQLIRIAGHVEASIMLAAGLSRHSLTIGELKALEIAYEDSLAQDAFARAYAGELCFVNSGLSRLGGEGFDADTPEMAALRESALKTGAPIGNREYSIREQVVFIEFLGPFANASDLTWPERMKLGREVETVVWKLPNSHVDAKDSLPQLLRAVQAFGREVAMLCTARVALAVECFRADAGALPDDLSQLVPKYLPALNADPFDGQPLRYKRLSNGYQVYSVGEDLKNDGGRQAERSDFGFLGDWVFEVRR